MRCGLGLPGRRDLSAGSLTGQGISHGSGVPYIDSTARPALYVCMHDRSVAPAQQRGRIPETMAGRSAHERGRSGRGRLRLNYQRQNSSRISLCRRGHHRPISR
jgi:hypothetical protein